MNKHLFLVVPLLTACAASPSSPTQDQTETARGSLGKADLAGECTPDTCGGRSEGSCWCDDLCTGFGDCCTNYEAVCTDTCDGQEEPVALEPVAIDATALIDLYNDGCPSGFTNCVMNDIEAFALPECVETPIDMEAVVNEALGQGQQGSVFEFGTVTDAAGLTTFFQRSSNAAATLAGLDALFQSSVVEAWVISAQIPCHNCTQFEDLGLGRYDNGTVTVLRGEHGFDS